MGTPHVLLCKFMLKLGDYVSGWPLKYSCVFALLHFGPPNRTSSVELCDYCNVTTTYPLVPHTPFILPPAENQAGLWPAIRIASFCSWQPIMAGRYLQEEAAYTLSYWSSKLAYLDLVVVVARPQSQRVAQLFLYICTQQNPLASTAFLRACVCCPSKRRVQSGRATRGFSTAIHCFALNPCTNFHLHRSGLLLQVLAKHTFYAQARLSFCSDPAHPRDSVQCFRFRHTTSTTLYNCYGCLLLWNVSLRADYAEQIFPAQRFLTAQCSQYVFIGCSLVILEMYLPPLLAARLSMYLLLLTQSMKILRVGCWKFSCIPVLCCCVQGKRHFRIFFLSTYVCV